MNDPPSLSRSAQHLLERDVDNIEQLEVLLLLRQAAERYWDAEAVADRLGLAVPVVAAALEMLGRRGFCDIRLADSIRYRFSPAREEQGEAIAAVSSSWRTDRTAILEILIAKQQALRDFSDAFRIRKGPRRG